MSGRSDMRMHPLNDIRRENIKITDIKVTLLSYLLKPEEQWTDGDDNVIIWQTSSVITEVFTDAGITGIGGSSRYNGPVEMKTYTEKVIRPLLLGKNPFDVEILKHRARAWEPQRIWNHSIEVQIQALQGGPPPPPLEF